MKTRITATLMIGLFFSFGLVMAADEPREESNADQVVASPPGTELTAQEREPTEGTPALALYTPVVEASTSSCGTIDPYCYGKPPEKGHRE